MKIVHVYWVDSHAMVNAWQPRAEFDKWFANDGGIDTVGYLAGESDTYLMVIQSISHHEPEAPYWDSAIKIPKSAIRWVKMLDETGERL